MMQCVATDLCTTRRGGKQVLVWMVDNIHIRTDPAGNVKPNKQKSAEKIAGVVATIMALDRVIRNGNQPRSHSAYNKRPRVL
nr:terminase TerL endonuclease subunit [Schaalia sp. ZJ1691]